MKTLIVFLMFITFRVNASESLLSCSPFGGQLVDKTLYITYSLEKNEVSGDATYSLKKTIFGNNGDESALEKYLYAPGFSFNELKEGFEFTYSIGEDLMLISGHFSSLPPKDETLTTGLILLEFKETVKPFLGLMEPPAGIATWLCLANLKELRVFSAAKEEKLKKIKKALFLK